MAQAKVSIDSLVKLAQLLQRGADDILSSKTDMDNQLHSFVWDDAVGQSFANRYEEDFKPLTETFIPAITDYIRHIEILEGHVSDYNPVAVVSGVATGVALGSASGIAVSRAATNATDDQTHKGKNQKDEKFVFSRKEDYKQLKKDPRYSRRYQSYMEALAGKEIRYRINPKDVDEINSKAFSLKEDELIVQFPEDIGGASIAGKTSKNIARVSKYAARIKNSSSCDVGAVGAHESTHVLQYKIYNEAKTIPFSDLSPRQKEIVKHFPLTYPVGTKEYYNDPMEVDARISEYAFNDACVAYIRQQSIMKTK